MFNNIKRFLKAPLVKVKRRFERVIKVPVYIPVFHGELLKGRRAFITGGSKGIGRAIAKAFLDSGCEVLITGRDENALNETITSLSANGASIHGMILDNTRPKEFADAVKSAFELYGVFDILVNNAGFTKGGYFGNCSEVQYDAVFDSILKGAWFLSQEFAAIWKRNHVKANILNICSASSLRPGQTPYICCKWAERAMTLGLAKNLVSSGITVNGLAPGLTSIERVHMEHHTEGLEWKKNPSGRYVTPEEVANMAVVLVSDLGRMVVGDVVYISGGGGVVTVDDA